jgi:peptidoglycan/LPS O-acetylase OafA/YrhL
VGLSVGLQHSQPDTAGVETWGYRAYLDGLRAVAVFLVIAFHSGADRLDGGFIGVDVFFVLSGYLVTQLLLRDLHSSGSIGYRRFYARRFRRLLPAAAVVLVVTAIVFPSVASPAELVGSKGAFRAAALYFANWFFIRRGTDYFAANIQSSPVVHFWSLSVEEQFYAAWPLLLGGIYLVARRFRDRVWTVVRITVAIGLLLSLVNALRLASTNLNRAYYGTDTRAYQLLAGALLALSPGLIVAARKEPRVQRLLPFVSAAALVSLIVLASSVVHVGAITRGALVTAVTVSLIASLESTTGGATRAVLSLAPVVYLGRISYGIYLWHWLVIIVATQSFGLSPVSTAIVTAFVASGLASLSYQLLERPVREARWLDQRRLRVLAVGLATSALIGLVVAPRIIDRSGGASHVVVAGGTSVSGETKIPANLDWRGALKAGQDELFPPCTAAAPAQCTLVHGTGKHILLMGDSNANAYVPALTELAKQRSLTLSVAVAPGCPWQAGILRRGVGQLASNVDDLAPPCRKHHAEWYNTILPALHPDIVIVANQPIDDPTIPHQISDEDRGPVDLGTKAFLDVITERTDAAIRALRATGAKVVIVEPIPESPLDQDPMSCLSKAKFFAECRFVSQIGSTPLERLYHASAAKDPGGVFDLNLDRQVCPYLPICDPVVNGLIVRWDPQHLTPGFAVTLAKPFGDFLDANNLLK